MHRESGQAEGNSRRQSGQSPRWRTSPLHLDIVGTGPYFEDLKAICTDLDVNDRVTFHGRVDDDELSRIYSSADVYLIPTTRYEGLPLALLEAMSHVHSYNLL